MKIKRTFLLTVVVTMGLLLGASAAQAAEVIFDPANEYKVIEIRNLDIGGTLYNVTFPEQATAEEVYGPAPGEYDFSDWESAQAAVRAVNAALNAAEPLPFWVGSEGGDNTMYNEQFLVGYGFTAAWGVFPDTVEAMVGQNFLKVEWRDIFLSEITTYHAPDRKTYAVFTPVPDTGNEPPVADAGGPYTGEIDVSITFDGTGSSDLDGIIVDYDWWFGDGNTGSGSTPSNAYSAAGVYNVTLTVTDNTGATNSDSTNAIIGLDNLPPVADAGGPYTGEIDASITFGGTGSSDLDGSIVAYDWAFGDGSTGSGATPSHAYSTADIYNVTLTVTDDDGGTGSDDTVAVIGLGNLRPVADAGGPYTGEVDVSITFDGTSSRDPDGSIVVYDWAFGDGSTGSGATPSHAYSADGIYYVTLTVTDDDDVTDSDGTVAATGLGNLPPVADAGGPYTGEIDASITFDGTGSRDPAGSIVAYDWAFGDGSTGSGATPSHAYSANGIYSVILTVTDDDGVTDSYGTSASIAPPSIAPPSNGGDGGNCFITTVTIGASPASHVEGLR